MVGRRTSATARLERLRQQEAGYQSELQRVEAELYATLGRLEQAEAELRLLEADVYALEGRIAAQEETIRERSRLYGERLRAMYKFSRTSPLEHLLTARNFSQALSQISLLRVIAREDTRLVERIRREQEVLAEELGRLEQKRRAGQELRGQIAAQREALAAQQAAKRRLLQDVEVSERQVSGELTDMDRQATALSATISQLAAQQRAQVEDLERTRREEEERRRRVAEERARLQAQAQTATRAGLAAPAAALTAALLPGAAAGWRWPLRGEVTTEFGERTFAQRFHTGIDIAAPRGAPIWAARDGVAIIRGLAVPGQPSGSYGMMVVLAHDTDTQTLYAHLDDGRQPPPAAIQPGRAVRQGQVVGHVGMTGVTSGPHLHFEVRLNGQFVDPRRYLR